MLQPYTAFIRQSEGWWIGWILEIRGVPCQDGKPLHLTDEGVEALRQSIEEGKIPIKFDSSFDLNEKEKE